jgi:hypothetical protein
VEDLMSKGQDPAYLFYSSDFLTGTQFMTWEQRGKYIYLLCMQHQTGHMQKQDMVELCGGYDAKIFEKFAQDIDGLFYNERLDIEISNRAGYVQSRRNNLSKKKTFTAPAVSEVIDFFKSNGYSEAGATLAWNYYNDGNWHDGKGQPVLNWKQKMRAVWFKPEHKLPASVTQTAIPQEHNKW